MHKYIFEYPFKITNVIFAIMFTLFDYKFCYDPITNLNAGKVKCSIGFYYTTMDLIDPTST